MDMRKSSSQRPELHAISESSLDDDLKDSDILLTEFAPATHKKNAKFHQLFPNIPDSDYLMEEHDCALRLDTLVQGRLYMSERHICFHANIVWGVTHLTIAMREITSLEKRITAFVIPNAIQIATQHAKYTFVSLITRDKIYDLILETWRRAQPDYSGPESLISPSSTSENSGPGAYEGWKGRACEQSAAAGGAASAATSGVRSSPPLTEKKTQCTCNKRGGHYSEVVLDVIMPGPPDEICNLMFTASFIRDFMKNEQKLMDIQITDWAPVLVAPRSNMLARSVSYIKPLTAGIGPTLTKCELRDEAVHCDRDSHFTIITTTRAPEVPSGGAFSVKTRTCIMWASAVSSRVWVTTQVEWSGRSFIKGIIEKLTIDGQKTYYMALDGAMRGYIQNHPGEFIPTDVDPSVVLPAEVSNLADEKAVFREEPLSKLPLETSYSTRDIVAFSASRLSPTMSGHTDSDEPDTPLFLLNRVQYESSTRITSSLYSTSSSLSIPLSYGPYEDHVSIYSGYNTRFVVDELALGVSERLGRSPAETQGTIYDMPPMYRCRVVHASRPPENVDYRGFPFFRLESGDLLDILRDEGHPKNHKLPVQIMNGEDCLLLVRDLQGRLGWILSHRDFNG